MPTDSNNKDSRQQTIEQLRELRLQEENLINDLLNNDGGLATKLQNWAQIVEELINSTDENYNFAVSYISTYIRRECFKRHLKFSHNVDRYLSEKYKNPNMVRIYHVTDKLEDALCPQVEDKSIEQFSLTELEFDHELLEKTDNEIDKLVMLINQKKEVIETEAARRGIKLNNQEYREPITKKQFRYDIPEYFGLAELNGQICEQGLRWANALYKFFTDKYVEYPTPIRQDAWKWANAIRVMANMQEAVNEDKWFGEYEHWFEREYCATIQSKHDAGNSTKFPTTLCANCSKDVSNDPKDCVKMVHWRPSPTGFRCPMCEGTAILGRENTREQVGDKAADVYRDATDVINYVPWYADVFLYYCKVVKVPEVGARKSAIAGEFSRSSMYGVDKQVVHVSEREKKGNA